MHDGMPKKGHDPLTLACEDSLDLDSKCVQAGPSGIMLYTYSGACIYAEKWPDIARNFWERYWGTYKYGTKPPKPVEFNMGWVDFFRGYRVDFLELSVNRIIDWDGSNESD